MSFIRSTKEHTKKRISRGFSIIELLAVLTIMLVITTVVRSSKTRYERSFALTNLAYDVALAVREAQVYGANVRQGPTLSTLPNPFDITYGVRFTTDSPTTLLLYADLNNNHAYDGTMIDSIVRQYSIKNGNTIPSLCTVAESASQCTATSVVDVTFRRPDTTACIGRGVGNATAKSSSDCIATTLQKEAQITVRASDGVATRLIKVFKSGQILVQ